jgi:drug/metabolite transporter (DMT)-like permease|tara:strand:- start:2643 stop:3512 length:870 start_codon:yes stop_codon:yes gene_type:complete
MQNENKGMLLGFIAVCAFGLTLPATRLATTYFDPIFIGLGRASLAAIVAAILLLIFKVKIPTKPQLAKLALVAAGVVIGFPVLTAVAMQTLPASHGGVVLGVLPLATATVAVVVAHERPSLGFWIVGFIGSCLVVTFTLIDGGGEIQLADLVLLGAILAAAVGYAVGATLVKELGGWQVICWALVLVFPLNVLPAINTAPDELASIPIQGWLCFLYLTLISQLCGFFIWYKGLALGGIARVSQIQLLQPFITLCAAVILLGETISMITMAFLLLVVVTVWLGKKMPIQS